MVFDHYTPEHAARLEAVLAEPDWQEALRDGTFDLAARTLRTPPAVTNVFALPVEQLKALNGARVQELIAAGERDEERLLSALGTWPSQWPADLPVRLSFVGLNLGFACDMVPRCLYCNQQPVREGVTLDQWKTLLRALPSEDGKGVYVYFTGGEPLVLGEGLWGEEGLIRAAGEANAASNVNTNGLSLTPRAALGLVSSGTGRLHLSMDTCRPEVADALYQREGCWRQVLRGLHNVQIAKALLRVAHPVIHLNCVLTRRNAAEFPEFVRFILSRKPLLPDALSPDLDFHLIPVGGEQNRALRLTAEGYERFFGETWAQAEDVWQKYLRERGVAAELQKTLTAQMPFLSPYHRVQQRGELCEWARRAAEGRPGDLARTQRCYVAPTQAFILPDGSQYWCGGHAIARPEPVGSVLEDEVRANIRGAVGQVSALPIPECRSCPGATLAINQTVEARLRQTLREWLDPQDSQPVSPEPPPVD